MSEAQPKGPNVFFAVPTYDGSIAAGISTARMEVQTTYPTMFQVRGGSLLAYQFNGLWVEALEAGADFFVMCHADIVPELGGIKKLIEECVALDADCVSAVSPIKTQDGITSTAVANEDELWRPRRFTMHEVYDFPETFDAAMTGNPDRALLVNTGLMVCNMKRPWVEGVCFTIKDKIVRGPDGKRQPLVLPEDWGFSWYLYEQGAKVYATRKVHLDHHGAFAFPNNQAWGTQKHDPAHPHLFPPEAELAVAAVG